MKINRYSRNITSLFLMSILTLFFIWDSNAFSEHHYQKKFCSNKGLIEYMLSDGTRVDCLTKTHAIEVDFAKKWYEALGQSLHYSRLTKKKAGIGLILEKQGDVAKYTSLMKVISHYSLPIDVFKIRGGIFTKKIISIEKTRVKKSINGICHEKKSKYYFRTKNFKSFSSLKECLSSGGRLPK